MKGLTRRRTASAGAAALLSVAAFWLDPFAPATAIDVAVAERRAFVETLVEAGTVSAARMSVYTAPVSSAQWKMIELVPEGTRVSSGDVLVRLDVSAVLLALQKEDALLRQAEAEHRRAQEQLRLERLAVDAQIDDARQDAGAKQRQADNERDGRGRVVVEEARAAEAEARREEARARVARDDIASLLAEGFATRAEIERAEQQLARAREALAVTSLKRELLERFDRPAAVELAAAELRAAEREAAHAVARADARVAQLEAAVAIAASVIEAARARVLALQQQADHSVVRAKGDGVVVHRDLFFGSDRRKPQVGDDVWPNQPLVALPESDSLTVETRVREVDLHRIALGRRSSISIDAYPDLRLTGTVSLVGAVAHEDPARNGAKFFPVVIKLVDSDPRLRIGMTARVDIEVTSLVDQVVVPVDAVFEKGDGYYAVVVAHGHRSRRPLRVLGRNDHVAAVEGLTAGETVVRSTAAAEQ